MRARVTIRDQAAGGYLDGFRRATKVAMPIRFGDLELFDAGVVRGVPALGLEAVVDAVEFAKC